MLPLVIHDLLIILATGLFAGIVCRWLQISVLVGYLVIGVLIGESALGWITDKQHEIEHLAEAGVFFLLFSIGLEFSLEELLKLGRHLLVGGSVQMLLVAGPVAGLLLGIGMEWPTALLIAAATSFSSTVLVFKALSEQGHSALPHGRRAIGILLFQDAALVPLLLLIPLLTGSETSSDVGAYARLAMISMLFVLSVVILRRALAKWIIPLLAGYRSPDLVVLLTLVCLGGVTWAAHSVGLPPAIGAFAAGLIFSGNRWTQQIDALVLPFRESFAAVFFVSLGLLADLSLLWQEPLIMLGGLAGLFVVKAVAAASALRLTGLSWLSSAGMGIGLAHVGEFAFVLILLGWESAMISDLHYQRLVTLAIGSLVLTPILLRTGLRLTRSETDSSEPPLQSNKPDLTGKGAIVIGAGPTGRQIASRLEITGKNVCVIDFSPLNLQPFSQQGFRTITGDATKRNVLELARVAEASTIVVCVSEDETALRIVNGLRALSKNCFVLVRCRFQSNVAKLRKAGASQVVSEEAQANDALIVILDSLTTNIMESPEDLADSRREKV